MELTTGSLLCLLFLGLLQIVTGEVVGEVSAKQSEAGFKVFGYFPDWLYDVFDAGNEKRLEKMCDTLTHAVFFSIEVDANGEMAALERFPSQDRLERLKKVCPKVKLMVSIGGNNRANGFLTVTSNGEKRRQFIANLEKFVNMHGLHGYDWDWEYPVSDQWEGYLNLTREARETMPNKIQTLKYFPDGKQSIILTHYNFCDNLDYLHSMAYDFGDNHSAFNFSTRSIENLMKLEVPPQKATLGLPLYARNPTTGGVKSIGELCGEDSPISCDKYTNHVDGFNFNSVDLLQRKTRYAFDEVKLGGVFLTFSSMDTSSLSVHTAINEVVVSTAVEITEDPNVCEE
mmetsp:Transcript_10037/g.13136  ORF Transcript_10037/g.13136 Transcript_10037/m.13136 type:complete len:343 (-) Transcript_10037:65-1093(-)